MIKYFEENNYDDDNELSYTKCKKYKYTQIQIQISQALYSDGLRKVKLPVVPRDECQERLASTDRFVIKMTTMMMMMMMMMMSVKRGLQAQIGLSS